MCIIYPAEGQQTTAYHTVYVIRNNLNNKIYVGAHSTRDIFDSYMGSGTYLKNAQRKYGLEHFSKYTLALFNTSDEMFAAEESIVNEAFLKREDVYNIRIGGRTSYTSFGIERTLEARKKISEALKGRKLSKEHCAKMSEVQKGRVASTEAKKNMCAAQQMFWQSEKAEKRRKDVSASKKGSNNYFFGKKLTEEHRKKISLKRKAAKGKYIWITDGNKDTRVKKEDLIPIGWSRGRMHMRDIIWITDGTKIKQFSSKVRIPEGWHQGRTINKN